MEKTVSEMFKALEGAADGAFVVDDELRIHTWNEAAEEILGFGNVDVLGQLCYQIIQGYDEEKRLICKACCQVAQLALNAEPVPNYDMRARTKGGDRHWLNMSIITSKLGENGNRQMIVHLFRDISQKKKDEIFLGQILETARRYHNIPDDLDYQSEPHQLIEYLTPREQEVLSLLVRGLSTQEIVETLSISPNTARNHIQHILQKLQVHSRLEAVTYALKNGRSD
jgi:PAS domain S-box-containing protein